MKGRDSRELELRAWDFIVAGRSWLRMKERMGSVDVVGTAASV